MEIRATTTTPPPIPCARACVGGGRSPRNRIRQPITSVAQAEEAVRVAREALGAVTADYHFWMAQYKKCVARGANESQTAAHQELTQQNLDSTKYGLDCAARVLSEARQELHSARQFFLEATRMSATDPSDEAAGGDHLNGSTRGENSDVAAFDASSLHSSTSMLRTASTTTATAATLANPSSLRGDIQSSNGQPHNVQYDVARGSNTSEQADDEALESPVSDSRARYKRGFLWESANELHYFPEDFEIPRCSLAEAWTLWCCGDENNAYPPLRFLTSSELPLRHTKKRFVELRYPMLWIEQRVRDLGLWHEDKLVTPVAATEMFDRVKGGIGVHRSKSERKVQPVEKLRVSSASALLRKQDKMEAGSTTQSIHVDAGGDPRCTTRVGGNSPQVSTTDANGEPPATATLLPQEDRRSGQYAAVVRLQTASGSFNQEHTASAGAIGSRSISPKRERSNDSEHTVLAAKRLRCSKTFLWERDGEMHHFPEYFEIPSCSVAELWELWCCGDQSRKYPPLRLLHSRDLTLHRAKLLFANFRRVVLWMENLMHDKNAWVGDNQHPTPETARATFDKVKTSIDAVRSTWAKRNHPLDRLRWLKFDEVLHERKKRAGAVTTAPHRALE